MKLLEEQNGQCNVKEQGQGNVKELLEKQRGQCNTRYQGTPRETERSG